MSQNIVLQGATYGAVPAVDLPKQGGGVARFMDTTDATAVAADILAGKTAYVNSALVTGTSSGGGGGPVLLATLSLGTISTTSTQAVDTGKSIAVSGLNNYDLLIFEASVDTLPSSGHTATVNTILLTAGSTISTKNGASLATATWNSRRSSGVTTTRAGTTKYGVYANAASVSNGTCTITIYQRYNSTSTGTINASYTARVYGVSLYDLIGG